MIKFVPGKTLKSVISGRVDFLKRFVVRLVTRKGHLLFSFLRFPFFAFLIGTTTDGWADLQSPLSSMGFVI